MGILTEDWSRIPPAGEVFRDEIADLGERPLIDDQISRYTAARNILMAFDAEPSNEVPPSALRIGKQSLEAFERAVEAHRRVSLDAMTAYYRGIDDHPGYREALEADRALVAAVDLFHAKLVAEVRPYIASGAVELARLARESMLRVDAINEAADRLARLEERAQTIIDRIGTGRIALHFEGEGKEQARAAVRWLWGIAIAGVLLIGVVIWLIAETLHRGGGARWEDIGAMFASKGLAIGVLSYVVSFCSRNYRAHRHLEATYRQRMASLDTYSLWASSLASAEAGARDIVLTELARAVFAGVDTGLAFSGASSGDKTIIENTVPLVQGLRGS